MPSSSERTDLRKADSKFEPIDITSPVAFILVLRVFSALVNLSKGQRGNLHTT